MDAKVEAAHEAGQKAKIFISYSRRDLAFADRLDAALKARGFEPLIDRSEIYAFEDWWKTHRGADRTRRHCCFRALARRGGIGGSAQRGRACGLAQQAHSRRSFAGALTTVRPRGAASAEFHFLR